MPVPQPAAPAFPAAQPAPAPQQAGGGGAGGRRSANGGNGGVHTATASLETVERAIGDLRVGAAGGRRGGGGKANGGPVLPNTEFDFQGNNARFDKSALRPTPREDGAESPAAGEEEEQGAYNPKKSFFDALTPTRGGPVGGERGGRGRGRGGRSRRDEERDKNVATFGEPGGVGLMGPGAYVGGYGGRRGGGGRGRRGGGGGGRS
jgi:protein LSM14